MSHIPSWNLVTVFALGTISSACLPLGSRVLRLHIFHVFLPAFPVRGGWGLCFVACRVISPTFGWAEVTSGYSQIFPNMFSDWEGLRAAIHSRWGYDLTLPLGMDIPGFQASRSPNLGIKFGRPAPC